VNALFRMKETERREPILEDPFAARFADDRWLVQAVRFGRFALPPLMRVLDELQTAHCVRHRAIDELVLNALADGYRQVVVVGAGYDMRPSRLPVGDVRWYELDRQQMIDRKRLRLGQRIVRPYESGALELGDQSIEPASRSPILEALAPTSFDPDGDTLYVLEGLIHFLSLPRLAALLADCTAGRGRRRVLLSYIRSEMFDQPDPRLVFLVRLLDEVPQLHFTPGHLSALCARQKLLKFTSWSYEQQVAAFAPAAAGRRVGATQDVVQVER
jgi:methyltransferase (TIGR00027 family)